MNISELQRWISRSAFRTGARIRPEPFSQRQTSNREPVSLYSFRLRSHDRRELLSGRSKPPCSNPSKFRAVRTRKVLEKKRTTAGQARLGNLAPRHGFEPRFTAP